MTLSRNFRNLKLHKYISNVKHGKDYLSFFNEKTLLILFWYLQLNQHSFLWQMIQFQGWAEKIVVGDKVSVPAPALSLCSLTLTNWTESKWADQKIESDKRENMDRHLHLLKKTFRLLFRYWFYFFVVILQQI